VDKACFERGRRIFERRQSCAGNSTGVAVWAAAISFATLVGFAAGCEVAPEARGQLILTLQTDMALPSQVNNVLIQVTGSSGDVIYMKPYSVGGNATDSPMPGSLAFNAGTSPDPLTFTVAGSKDDLWKTYREVVTTVPLDRVAELRMPLQWLCDDSAEPKTESAPDGRGGVVNRVIQTCDPGLTCKAGECVSSETPEDVLITYDPAMLYGGAKEPADGTCFDVLKCMSAGTRVEPDFSCTIEKPLDENINVALRVAGGGICNEGVTTTCFVPLDGEDAEGWYTTEDGMRLQLPQKVCDRIVERRVLAVQVSTACQMKTATLPPCAPWSAVPDDRAIIPGGGAGPGLIPELFVTLPFGESTSCCPLLSDGTQLYSCACAGKPEDGDASSVLHSVEIPSKRRDMFPVGGRHITQAAAIANQTLYWGGEAQAMNGMSRSDLFQLPLQSGELVTSTPGIGGFYTKGMALADASGVHLLMSGLGEVGEAERVVYLLHYAFSGELTSMDALGNRVVMQFAQDDGAFYAVKNVDQAAASAGQPFERVSSVQRIDKQTHAATSLLNEQTMTISDLKYSGYVGVVSDGSNVFALFQTAPTDGLERFQIGRVSSPATAGSSDLQPIYELEVVAEKHQTAIRLLGAVDGAVFFARDEVFEGGSYSSSVLMLRDGAERPQFIADFTADLPVAGVVASEDRVFWLNQTGRIFAIPRGVLAP
jgi:hypothetical protein